MIRIGIVLRAVVFAILPVAPSFAWAEEGLQPFLEQTLAAVREKDHLPAVAALVQIDGKLAAEAALGVRALGHSESVTTSDRWHIGSDTKAFTATLIARLVEQGIMRFDDTLAASFPAFADGHEPRLSQCDCDPALESHGRPATSDRRQGAARVHGRDQVGERR